MKDDIIKIIKSFNPILDTNDIDYSNHSVDIKKLISLCNFRLEMYDKIKLDISDKTNLEYIDFLNKKIQSYTYLDELGVENVKMVHVDKHIYYFDENFSKIYLIINNIKKEVKTILE